MTNLNELSEEFGALEVVQSLLGPWCNFTNQYFTRTRNYQNGLEFISYCRDVIDYNKDKLDTAMLEQYDRCLGILELNMLDHQNQWEYYLEKYEQFIQKFPDEEQYIAWRKEITSRKITKLKSGKNVEHLKRHQAEKLTIQEQEYRQSEMLRLFKEVLLRNYKKK